MEEKKDTPNNFSLAQTEAKQSIRKDKDVLVFKQQLSEDAVVMESQNNAGKW
jgi:hypothetical protein